MAPKRTLEIIILLMMLNASVGDQVLHAHDVGSIANGGMRLVAGRRRMGLKD
jgi:hypothetical protein